MRAGWSSGRRMGWRKAGMKVVKRWRRRKGITATGNQYLPGSPALLITSLNEGSQRSLLF